MASKFRISGGCERGTGTIHLMEGPVFRARPLSKTDLSVAAVSDFGLDPG